MDDLVRVTFDQIPESVKTAGECGEGPVDGDQRRRRDDCP